MERRQRKRVGVARNFAMVLFIPLGMMCLVGATLELERKVVDFNIDLNSTQTTLELSQVDAHSVLVKIYAQSPLPENSVDHFITILAPENHKLVGFVAMAYLRVNWTNTTSLMEDGQLDFVPECVDYLKFGGGGEKVCHNVRKGDARLHPSSLIGPRSWKGSVGTSLEMHFHTGPFQNQNHNNTTRHLAEVAFTVYSECPEEDDDDENTSTEWFRCSLEDDFSCMPSSLLCDKEVHCLFPEGIGEDEKGCHQQEVEEGEIPSEDTLKRNNTSSSSSSSSERGFKRRIHKNSNNTKNPKESVVVVVQENEEGHQIRQYFLPTASFFFLIWGVVTLLRKCYKCYRSEYGKEELFY